MDTVRRYDKKFINTNSHYKLAQKHGVLNALIHRTRVISELAHLKEELDHLRIILRTNGYSRANIKKGIRTKHERNEPGEHLVSTYLPHVEGCIDKIGHLLSKLQVNTVFVTQRCPGPSKDTVYTKTLQHRVYSIPCWRRTDRMNSNYQDPET